MAGDGACLGWALTCCPWTCVQDGDKLTLYKPKDPKKPPITFVFNERPEGRTPEAKDVRPPRYAQGQGSCRRTKRSFITCH
jgi:hypothetical protein